MCATSRCVWRSAGQPGLDQAITGSLIGTRCPGGTVKRGRFPGKVGGSGLPLLAELTSRDRSCGAARVPQIVAPDFLRLHPAKRQPSREAIRADDRDYTGDLWGNVETCLFGCTLGVAIFESLVEPEAQRFNPNVALELGHMLGRGRRCLILKEDSLTSRPADIIHKLYRPFTGSRAEVTIEPELTRWIERDLRR